MGVHCRLCRTMMDVNAGFNMCPHCDKPCFRSRPMKRCDLCKRVDEADKDA